MTLQYILLSFVVVSTVSVVYADQSVVITLGESEYTYCEKLFYEIKVDKVAVPNEPATIHIIDANGTSSSPIPILITDTTTPIPARVPFEDPPFAPGRYTISVEYVGDRASAEFELVESDTICLSSNIRPILGAWIAGDFTDGFVIDTLQKNIDHTIIDIPFTLDRDNFYNIYIPDWVRMPVYWWLEGAISDEELVALLQYLLDESVITVRE